MLLSYRGDSERVHRDIRSPRPCGRTADAVGSAHSMGVPPIGDVTCDTACVSTADAQDPFLHDELFKEYPVPMRLGDTPVPIPNTTVKTQAADGTMLETAWESRRVPDT